MAVEDGDERIKRLMHTAKREQQNSHRIVLAGSADLAPYEYLSDAQLRVPRECRLWPDDELLEIHYRRFVAQQAVA